MGIYWEQQFPRLPRIQAVIKGPPCRPGPDCTPRTKHVRPLLHPGSQSPHPPRAARSGASRADPPTASLPEGVGSFRPEVQELGSTSRTLPRERAPLGSGVTPREGCGVGRGSLLAWGRSRTENAAEVPPPHPRYPPSELRGKKGCSFTKRLLCTGTAETVLVVMETARWSPEGNRWGKPPQSSGWDLSKDTWPVCGGATALTGYLALGRLPPFPGPQFPPVSNEAN